jgi:SAM-dependent methyltransferase
MSLSLHPCAAAPAGLPPSAWVERWLGLLAPGATVLDFAAGAGRHALEARRRGLRASAIDRDAAALAAIGAGVAVRTADLEAGPWPFGDERYDAVVVANYLFRPRFALLAALLAPGGLLIYETFAQGNERFGRPSNPAFLLAPGELVERSRAAGLLVLGYEHGRVERPKPAVVQRVCALRAGAAGDVPALG